MSHVTFDEMTQAMKEARITLNRADQFAEAMADMLCGRLTCVNRHTLVKLKRELSGFDAQRREWKKFQ